jgi:hypothetical protein
MPLPHGGRLPARPALLSVEIGVSHRRRRHTLARAALHCHTLWILIDDHTCRVANAPVKATSCAAEQVTPSKFRPVIRVL